MGFESKALTVAHHLLDITSHDAYITGVIIPSTVAEQLLEEGWELTTRMPDDNLSVLDHPQWSAVGDVLDFVYGPPNFRHTLSQEFSAFTHPPFPPKTQAECEFPPCITAQLEPTVAAKKSGSRVSTETTHQSVKIVISWGHLATMRLAERRIGDLSHHIPPEKHSRIPQLINSLERANYYAPELPPDLKNDTLITPIYSKTDLLTRVSMALSNPRTQVTLNHAAHPIHDQFCITQTSFLLTTPLFGQV